MLCVKPTNFTFASPSHVLQIVQSGLHLVDIVCVGSCRLCCDWSVDLVLASNDLAVGIHNLLVAHLVKKCHHLTIVDRCRVNVVQGSVHVSSLDVHVLKDGLEATNAASHTQAIHLLHCFLQHGDRALDLRRDLLRAMSRLKFCGEGAHFDTKATQVDRFLPVADHVLSEYLGVLHLILVKSLHERKERCD